MKAWEIRQGDWVEVLHTMPDESVHCVVTSPPYWGLRDYGVTGQLGLERTPEEYVAKMVEGFREVRRVLRDDGTLWLNLGDSYAGSWGAQGGPSNLGLPPAGVYADKSPTRNPRAIGLKSKDLCGIPWMVAFALRSDGWYLRQDIIWSKPNPMPESVRDRCTKAHEYIFLLSKSERYYYDQDAIRELAATEDMRRPYAPGQVDNRGNGHDRGGGELRKVKIPGGWETKEGAHGTIHRDGRTSAEYQEVEVSPYRNKRSVWGVATSPFPEAHFATFPPEIPETCIKAGCPEGGTVLDPFNGAGTTGLVATRLGRNYIGIELNPEYIRMAEARIIGDAPLFNAQTREADAR